MFDLGSTWRVNFGRFYAPSDAYLQVADGLVFSSLSWPTLDRPSLLGLMWVSLSLSLWQSYGCH